MNSEMETQFYESINKRKESIPIEEEKADELSKSINWDLLATKISFGKHKGTQLRYLDKSYLVWLIKNNILKNADQTEQLKLMLKLFRLRDHISFLYRDHCD